ncbi:MAG: ABC-2 family transporter protein [Clostridiales bacterium]|jgi:ABC-2 type transport system permease protein|nr:ABC-2 family transporter protein [Clostridiales bacterium]
MKRVLIRKIKIFQQVILISFKQWAAYRSNILTVFIIAPLGMLAQYFIWRAVIASNGDIIGMDFAQILTYYAITTTLGIFLADDVAGTLRGLIYSGDLNSYLLKPVSYFQYALAEKIGKKILSVFFELIPLLLIFIFIFRINLIPHNIYWFILSVLLSFVMIFLINYCVGITAFWLTNNWGVNMAVGVLINFSSGLLLPLSLFPLSVQKLLFVLPFQYMYYIPAKVFLGNYELAGLTMSVPYIVLIQFAYVFIIWSLIGIIWKRGIKKFMGVGT